jgi:hypothetical protein
MDLQPRGRDRKTVFKAWHFAAAVVRGGRRRRRRRRRSSLIIACERTT